MPLASASFIVSKSTVESRKRKKRAVTPRKSRENREKYTGTNFLNDCNGSFFNNFNRISVMDFEKIICLDQLFHIQFNTNLLSLVLHYISLFVIYIFVVP